MELMIKKEIEKQTVGVNRNRKDQSYDNDEEGDGYDTDHKKKRTSKKRKGKDKKLKKIKSKPEIIMKSVGTQTENESGFWQKLLQQIQCVPNPNTE